MLFSLSQKTARMQSNYLNSVIFFYSTIFNGSVTKNMKNSRIQSRPAKNRKQDSICYKKRKTAHATFFNRLQNVYETEQK
ncbi:MAG: hypothetical protein D3924_15380 [Candidatus Electrothrix sp. AR4]|nr:hypothetical protein [Candidatus Electrothrix sp. AR4]